MIFVFDGTFEGLLTSVFEFYERKPKQFQLVSAANFHPVLMEEVIEVVSDDEKSNRVWKGLKKKISGEFLQRLYYVFLSEQEESFRHIFDFIRYVFDSKLENPEKDYGHPSVIALTKIAKSVSRERHRMKAFIRFQETSDGIFYAPIDPDFNVLPLIANFFKNRYADQQWIIYDLKRKYGLYYNLISVEEIKFDIVPELNHQTPEKSLIGDKEELFSVLWNDYFKSTNIPARKNMKLHIQHVPKRYWKYLTEKRTLD